MDISHRSVNNYLNRCGIYRKSCTNAPFITEIPNKRLEFNLDVNDSSLEFWGDKEMKLKNSKLKYGGGSIMIWIGVSRYLKALIIKIKHTIDDTEYQRMLENMFGDWPKEYNISAG
ncbi:hypothetical protein RF11_07346 [Thelohanellus kitauei]|uniref:Transposase n=1 Tax=Thelohanellus kitauei TaxID=669202 RepID=A0A0C2IZ05_THEKT|nr:hypothetical protein RF11_07346 [Thelohanellus kitauei]